MSFGPFRSPRLFPDAARPCSYNALSYLTAPLRIIRGGG